MGGADKTSKIKDNYGSRFSLCAQESRERDSQDRGDCTTALGQ